MTEDTERAPWRTSSYSANQGDCVEVAPLPQTVGVRDTKSRARGHFTVTRTTWSAFTRAAASGELTR